MNDVELIERLLAGEDGPSDAGRVRARARLVGAATAEGRRRGRRRRIPGRLRLVPTLGLGGLALAAISGLLIVSVIRGGAGQPAPASAAAVLRRAAAAALASPPAHLGPGQWWYSEDVGTYRDEASARQGTIAAYVSETERYWIGRDRWVRREQLHDIRPAQPITQPWQKAEMRLFGPNPSLHERNDQFDLPVSYAGLLHAPLAAAALARFVLSSVMAPHVTVAPRYRHFAMVNAIHEILIEPMVPGRLRAALFRVAATIPGAQMLGRVRDHLGRPAIAIGFAVADQDTEYELLFDPRSYVLLDDREVDLHRRTELYSNTAFVRSGVVGRIGATPAATGG